MSIFDNPPLGYSRVSSKGWLAVSPSPQRKTIDRLKSENTDLKDRLEQLEAVVAEIASGKKKK